jgi:hypothetical protein
MDQINSNAMQTKHDPHRNAPMGKELRHFKDTCDALNAINGSWRIVANMNELLNNSLYRDRIKIRGNMDMVFDIPETLLDFEVDGNLRCKDIKSERGIMVTGNIKAESLEAKSVHALNMICSSIKASEEIFAEGQIFANSLEGGDIRANELHVTERISGKDVRAAIIYAGDVKAERITCNEVEAKRGISCEVLDSKIFKAKEVRVKEILIKNSQ